MVGKRVQFDDETWEAIETLMHDSGLSFQVLADEAFADLLKRPRNLRAELLGRAAQKLAEFLRKAKDPRAVREQAARILSSQNVLMGPAHLEETNPVTFAVALIEENPLLQEAVGNLQFRLDPEGALNVEDLLLSLSPSRGD